MPLLRCRSSCARSAALAVAHIQIEGELNDGAFQHSIRGSDSVADSKSTSRAKGSHRKLGDLVSDR
jgi:hypothetical protein